MGVLIPLFRAELEVREVQKVAKKRVFRPFHPQRQNFRSIFSAEKILLKILHLPCEFWYPKVSRFREPEGQKHEKRPLAQAREYGGFGSLSRPSQQVPLIPKASTKFSDQWKTVPLLIEEAWRAMRVSEAENSWSPTDTKLVRLFQGDVLNVFRWFEVEQTVRW